MLISKDYKEDAYAVEPVAVSSNKNSDDDAEGAEELATMFGQMNVRAVACQMCQTE
jgi:hypothetical protein